MQVWTNKKNNGPVDSYDYDLEINSNRVRIKYSNSVEWSEPGEKFGELIDDGDGVVIKLRNRKPLVMEYFEVVEILTLLLASHKDKIEIKEYITIKSI